MYGVSARAGIITCELVLRHSVSDSPGSRMVLYYLYFYFFVQFFDRKHADTISDSCLFENGSRSIDSVEWAEQERSSERPRVNRILDNPKFSIEFVVRGLYERQKRSAVEKRITIDSNILERKKPTFHLELIELPNWNDEQLGRNEYTAPFELQCYDINIQCNF